MRLRRSALRDLGLLLLAALTVAAALYAVTRSPSGGASGPQVLRPSQQPSPSASAAAGPVRALFVGSESLGTEDEGLGASAQRLLGWSVTSDAVPGSGFVAGPQGGTLADRVPELVDGEDFDVVLVSSSVAGAEGEDLPRLGGNAAFVVSAVRKALPAAQIVLMGPVSAEGDAFVAERDVLRQVAARFGAVFVDPVGGQWLTSPEQVADGVLTAAGTEQVAARLVGDLRTVLPAPLLLGASPAPS